MYFKYCKVFIEIEKIFSQLQSVKILNYMGLTYNDLVNNTHKCELYKENTHVLSYYILPACILSFMHSLFDSVEKIVLKLNLSCSIIAISIKR